MFTIPLSFFSLINLPLPYFCPPLGVHHSTVAGSGTKGFAASNSSSVSTMTSSTSETSDLIAAKASELQILPETSLNRRHSCQLVRVPYRIVSLSLSKSWKVIGSILLWHVAASCRCRHSSQARSQLEGR